MDEGFRSLASVLRERTVAPSRAKALVEAVAIREEAAPESAVPSTAVVPDSLITFYGEIARARVAALEAFERGVATLLEAFGREVLARELASVPADLAALAQRLVAEFADAQPVAVLVAPSEVAATACAVEVRGDASLAPGDVVLLVRDGTVDARLQLRVNAALREARG